MLQAVVTPAAYGHFAMPRSFYLLISASAVGYFGVIAGHSLLVSWRAKYRKAISEARESIAGKWRVPVTNLTFIIGALFHFFSGRLWWWFAPSLAVLGFWIGLVIYTRETVIAVTPFIYTLF